MNKEKLTAAGVDYEQGVQRFSNRPQIYEKFLLKFFDSGLVETLGQQLEQSDYAAAFRTAHDLKGTSGNLSLNAFYTKLCELVELLRGDVPNGETVRRLFAQVRDLYERAENAIKE